MVLESPNRIGNIEELIGTKALLMPIKRSSPEIIGFLIAKRGLEQAAKDLYDIGGLIAERILMVWSPKKTEPFEIFKEAGRKFFGNKKIKKRVLERVNGRDSIISVQDRNCPVCPTEKGQELEEQLRKINHCIMISGFIEAVIKHQIATQSLPYSDIKCETVKSVSSGDEYCEHILTIKY